MMLTKANKKISESTLSGIMDEFDCSTKGGVS